MPPWWAAASGRPIGRRWRTGRGGRLGRRGWRCRWPGGLAGSRWAQEDDVVLAVTKSRVPRWAMAAFEAPGVVEVEPPTTSGDGNLAARIRPSRRGIRGRRPPVADRRPGIPRRSRSRAGPLGQTPTALRASSGLQRPGQVRQLRRSCRGGWGRAAITPPAHRGRAGCRSR